MKKQTLVNNIKTCISIDFEHAQYRMGVGLGCGSSVFAALDDALFMLSENGNDDELADNEFVITAFEQLLNDYQGSGNFCVIPRLCWRSSNPNDYDVSFESVIDSHVREAELDQDWSNEETTIDGLVLDLDDERYDVIPADTRRKIRADIAESEYYFYIDFDAREVRELLLDYAEELAELAAK